VYLAHILSYPQDSCTLQQEPPCSRQLHTATRTSMLKVH